MRSLRSLLLRLRDSFRRDKLEHELGDELASHLAMHIEDNVRAGMSPEEARRTALLKLGGLEQTKETYRERRGLPLFETLWQDLRFGLRVLRKNPGFTAVAVITLALGIGANTAIFGIVNAVILRPLPYKDSSRIVVFHTKNAMFPTFTLNLSWLAFQEIRTQAASLKEAAAWWETENTVTGANQPAVLKIASVSDGFFELLGARAEQGRLLRDEDLKADRIRVVVISDTLWRTRFAKDPAVIGRSMALDNQVYTVVGVTEKGFAFPEDAEVWTPLAITADVQQNPTFFKLEVFGRLRSGATLEKLEAELGIIAPRLESRLAKEKPEFAGDYKLLAETLLDSRVEDARQSYLVLLAAATFVLLIACANLTSLFLARGWGRHREMAMRAALGASSWRLHCQALVESCLLAVLGGVAGIALAVGGLQLFRAVAPSGTARLNEVSTDATLLWFALGSSLVCGIVCGLAPARRAARMTPNHLLKNGSGGSIKGGPRLGNLLVVVEVALAFVLLIGSTLLMQTLAHLLRQNPGFHTDHLLTFDLPQPQTLGEKEKEENKTGQIARLKEILAQVRQLPGVVDVVAADHGVLNGLRASHAGMQLEGALPEREQVSQGVVLRQVSPGYFRMLGVPLVRGREFEERDSLSAQKVMIVNESMAKKFWGRLNVVGKRMSISRDAKGNPEWNEIVGVVADVRDLDVQSEPEPEYYPALFQWGVGSQHLIVRTQVSPDAMADTISRRIWASFPDQPLTNVTTLTRTIADSVGDQRMHMSLLGVFAGIGLMLALIGVYGVVSYSVAGRTKEFGVRMALGAGWAEVLRMVLWQGLRLVALGSAIGVLGALATTRVIASELYGVTPSDPWTFAGAVVLILLVGGLACWIPARRATKVDPLEALRYE
jgi:putative ABC transport system permease protein